MGQVRERHLISLAGVAVEFQVPLHLTEPDDANLVDGSNRFHFLRRNFVLRD